jgi:hypothetical protein
LPVPSLRHWRAQPGSPGEQPGLPRRAPAVTALPAAKINPAVPHSARVWNYWLGGKDYYPADKEAGDAGLARCPAIADTVRQLRYLSARAVRYLAGEAGVRQFLDIGAGMPFLDPVHEVARSAGPGSRVVYADSDPLAMAHAQALLTGSPGAVGYADADLNDPGALLGQAAAPLDFTRPVAVLLFSVMGHIGDPRDDDDRAARNVTGALAAALPPGGFLAIGDLVAHPAQGNAMAGYGAAGAAPYHLRAPRQLARLLDGLELTAPGVVPACRWRPEHSPFPPPKLPAWGGVGRRT